jgi:class 3 adenylate cyclase
MPSTERKIATMLFADLVGSTKLASSADPEQTRVMLDRFYDSMADEIEATGGTIEKFAGDAVMAVFGVPVAHEDHAERALHTALAMRSRLRERFGERLKLRIGVSTGEVVVGQPRLGSSFVSGDAVNAAARLEQGAAPDEILVSERTATAAGTAFELSEPTTIEAKGKSGGIVARRLIAALAVSRPRGGLGDAFVGREHELAKIEAAYARVVERGQPELVLLVGEAGVGKSRLVSEVSRWLGRQTPPPLERSGRCPSYGRGLTYRPLADVLRQELGLETSDPPTRVLELLGGRAILGLAFGLDVTGELHPLVVRERFHGAWVELLGDLASRQPMVLVIEDLHWAEEPLLALLRDLRRRIEGPLLLVATARAEGAEGLYADLRLDLSPLTSENAADMVATLLGNGVPTRVRDLVITRAEGNPFFIEELLATLIDRQVLTRPNGSWRLEGSLDQVDLPDTVQAVLAARLDLLSAPEKRALQTAAVIGRVFWDASLHELVDGPEADLDVLEQRGFIRSRTGSSVTGEREYAFKHQLTREVAYSSLPKAERGRLHAAVARRLEQGVADAMAAVLAHHYEQAVRSDYVDLAWGDDPVELERLRHKALEWLRLAAERATARYEMDAAVSMLGRALELAEDEPTRYALWRALASAHALRYDAKGLVLASEHAIGLAPDARSITGIYAELALRSSTSPLMWNPPLERELAARWVAGALTGAAGNSRERAMGLLAMARFEDGGETPAGEGPAREALAIAEQLDEPELLAFALRTCVLASLAAGRYDLAALDCERLVSVIGAVEDPGHKETLLQIPLRVAAATGRFDEARRFNTVIDELVRELTPHHRVHGLAYILEVEELAAGWARIRELGRRVERAVEENRETPCVRNARSLLVCAVAEAALGADDEARRFEALAAELGMAGHEGSLDPPRIRLALLRGDKPEARRLLERYGRPRLQYLFDLSAAAVWLDAAVALGLHASIEEEAPALAQPGAWIEPFALRALGVVRQDAALLARASRRFAELGLRWYDAWSSPVVGRG